MPIYHPLLNSNIFITLALLFLVSMSIFISINHRAKFNILRAIFNPAAARDFNTPISSFSLSSIVLTIFALLGYGVLLLYIIPAPETWLNLGIAIAVIFLFFTIKYVVILLFFNTMFKGVEKNFLTRYHHFNVLTGIVCFVSCMLLAFSFDSSHTNVVITSAVIGLLYCAGASYIFITTFFDNLLSVVRLFLYLCTLEILPALTLVSALSRV